jgi:hypothetical protein
MIATDGVLSRDGVKEFLTGLMQHLYSRLPDRESIKSRVEQLLLKDGRQSAVSQTWTKRPEGPESAFLGEFILPQLEDFLKTRGDQTLVAQDPSSAICVGFAAPHKYRQRVSIEGHPFGKIALKPEDLYRRWKEKQIALIQSYPDITLLAPYRILFEGKYFKRNLKSPARTQLVSDLYETFFYRALPKLPASKKRLAWDYPYACFLAYDASEDGALLKAWNDLPEKVKKAFWENANIFVMILPASPGAPNS